MNEARRRFDHAHSASASALSSHITGSVSLWIRGLQEAGDQRAANLLYQRYFGQLVSRLRSRLNRKLNSIADSEETAQYVLAEVLSKLEKGKFPQLSDRDSLWALMIHIGDQRSRQIWRYATADKRDIRRTVGQTPHQTNEDAVQFDPESPVPPDRLEIEIEDMLEYLTRRLSKKYYRHLLVWELQGDSSSEMKRKLEEELGRPVTERSFRRWREKMRSELRAAYPKDCDEA